MDAQSRGRAGDIDPADQWVFDPKTGSYTLRLDPAGDHQAPPSRRRASTSTAGREDESRQEEGQKDGRRAEGGSRAASSRASGARSAGGRATGSRAAGTRAAGARAAGSRAPGGQEDDTRTRELPRQRGHRSANRAAAQTSAGRRRPRPKKSGGKKALRWTGGALAFVLIGGGATAYFFYQHLNGNIDKVDVGVENAAVTDGPVNILVIGTDTRSGKGNGSYGDKDSVGHADTTILFHVSEDRTNATALSIPRDMVTDIPDCPTKGEDGQTTTIPGQQGVRFNTSLGQSGRDPGCTWRTVEELTGLKVHHFMMADFNAVKTLSTAVGGVEVCLAKDIDDPKSKLKLDKGRHNVKGEQALAFVRTRHSVGFESDLDRIKLQQQFLSSMIRKMKSGDTLTNPKKLFDLGNAATKALTVDTGIGSVDKLTALAKDLRQVDLKNISFATVPVVDSADGATVVLDEAKARPLFSMVKQDVSLTEVKKREKDAEAARLKGPKADASEVRVEVLNGSGTIGAAQETVDWLQNTQGVPLSSNGGNSSGTEQPKTALEYAPNQADQARRLAEMMGLPASALKPGTEDAAPKAEMTLTLGGDFKGAGTPISAPAKAPEGVQKVKADDRNLCAK